jgi:hypothetical protein
MDNKYVITRQVTEDLYDGYICQSTSNTRLVLEFLISLLDEKGLKSFAEEFGYVVEEESKQ